MNIIITEPAQQDLENIKTYIAKDSLFYADVFVQKLFATIENLLPFPKIGKKVLETNNQNIRQIFHKDYRIIYQITPDNLYILAVIHGSRDITKRKNRSWEKDQK